MTVKPEPAVRRSVVSETRFPNDDSLDRLRAYLRTLKATGKLVVNMSQGGVNSVSFEAKYPLNGEGHVELIFTPVDVDQKI